MMTATECPTQEQLKALALGQLSYEDSDALFQHIADCPDCRSGLETVEDAGDSLIVSLRNPVDHEGYCEEPDCRLAVAKALGALAQSETDLAKPEWLALPTTIGEYEIMQPIGKGGMGNVYLARHTKLGRQVALKVLASHRLADTRTLERFEAEMRAVGRLSHPNIVTAHDAREVNGTAVLVTEYVNGLDLGQLLLRSGPLQFADACEIVRQVAVALTYTHSQGFIHRDIKPSNVMLSTNGEIKLLDLGLARLQFGEDDCTEITGTGQTMGTADYIAPEQVTDSKSVDIRADIYALGCTLFKLLTGRAPFADDRHLTAFSKMTAHISTKPPSLGTLLPTLPRSLVQLVDSMLAKQPVDRPQLPRDVVLALSPHCKGHDLPKLISDALNTEPRKHAIATTSSHAKPKTQSRMKRTVPYWVAIAAGLLGVLLGICLSIIIVITNPDGTQTVLQLAKGSKVELHEGTANAVHNAATIPADGANQSGNEITPLSFGILVNRDSTGHSPSAKDTQILEATQLLRASDGSKPVRTKIGTWYATADQEMGAPIKELNAGKTFVLVSDQHFINWPSVQGHVINSQTKTGKSESSIELNLDEQLGRQMAKLTKENLRNQLAIIANGKVRAAPMINSEVGQQVLITGRFDPSEVKQLSQWLHGGLIDPLPKAKVDDNATLTKKPFLKGYDISQVDHRVAYDVASFLLEGKKEVRLSNNSQDNQLILFAYPEEHELLEKTLAELTKGRMDEAKSLSRLSSLKQQLLGLEFELAKLQELRVDDHPSIKATQNQIKMVQEEILGYESPDKSKQKLADLQFILRQLGLAFQNHESAYRKLPGTSNLREMGVPDGEKTYPFSWRVAILPFIEHADLYNQYRFDQPWDSEHNAKLLDKMPAMYRSPFAPADQETGETNFLGFASKDSALGIGDGEQLNAFPDGTSHTLLLVETACTVPWTKPQDIPSGAEQAVFFDDHPFTYLMADGQVKTVNIRPTIEVLNGMINRNDGRTEMVERDANRSNKPY